MAVRGKVKLLKDPNRSWVLILVDPENIKKQAVEKFIKHDTTVSVILDMEIRRPHIEKTLSQLGYLHAAVWPVFYQWYEDQGIPSESKEQQERVRDDVKSAIGFIEMSPIMFGPNAGMEWAKVKSFADASKEETSEALEAIIRLAAEYGMVIQTPQEYLQKHNAVEFQE